MRITKINTIAYMMIAAIAEPAVASQQSESNGFVEDSKASLLVRNVYMNRDFRQANAPQNKGEEWGQGFMANYQSGFTQGTVGFGVDALGKLGIMLDSGAGRTGGGTGLLERDSGGPKADYSKMGGALKIQMSDTILKYGDQMVSLPILSTNDARLLPESATGLSLTSKEFKNLTLNAGHFTALNKRNDSSPDSARLTDLDYVGGVYKFNDQLTGSFYRQTIDNYWRKYYGSATYTVALSNTQAFNLDFNMYDTKSMGEERAGDLDNRLWSLSAAYTLGAHRFMLARQTVSGRGDYTYGIDGLSAMYTSNSVQYSDFLYEGEKSWQARYDLNMAPYGIPGLTFMVRYIKGYDFNTPLTDEGKAWERDIDVKYVVQSGPAKNLSLRARNATYRSSDRGGDVDEIRLIFEYPISIF